MYRLTLDENVDREGLHRLDSYGNDVEHGDFVPELGKGTAEYPITQYSLETDRVIVPSDDDFVLEVPVGESREVSYFADATLSARQVVDVIHTGSQNAPRDEPQGFEYVGEGWR